MKIEFIWQNVISGWLRDKENRVNQFHKTRRIHIRDQYKGNEFALCGRYYFPDEEIGWEVVDEDYVNENEKRVCKKCLGKLKEFNEKEELIK